MWHADDGQLNALLDGELSPAEAREVQAHLATCAACTRRLEEARVFLSEAGELLNVLTPPTAAAAVPTPDPQEVPLVAPRAPGPADSSSTRKPADSPASSGAVSMPKTAKEVAVEIDGRTAMTPAIRPVTRVEPAWQPPARKGWFELEKLAWAASLILCVGVGYLANEVYHLKHQASQAAQSTALTDAQPVEDRAAPAREPATRRAPAPLPAPATATATHAPRPGAGGPSRLADSRGTTAAHAPGTAAKPGPISKPAPTFARPERSAEVALAQPPSPNAGAGMAQQQPAPSGAANRAAPRSITEAIGDLAGAPAAAPAPRDAVSRSRAAQAPAAAAADQPATTFRRITLEDAVRILSGSIRLIDGMQPARVDAGPGRLVAGADPGRDVVRVTYGEGRGRLYLDQQLGDTRTGSFNGLMQGDTLVTTGESGGTRVRWVDRKFWLSLTGSVPADSLRSFVMRVR